MTSEAPDGSDESDEQALAWAPTRHHDLTLVRGPDGAVLVDVEAGPRLRLNDTAAAVWELCDGATTVREMLVAMGQLWAAPPSVLAKDVLPVVRDLVTAGSLLLDEPDLTDEREREADPSSDAASEGGYDT